MAIEHAIVPYYFHVPVKEDPIACRRLSQEGGWESHLDGKLKPHCQSRCRARTNHHTVEFCLLKHHFSYVRVNHSTCHILSKTNMKRGAIWKTILFRFNAAWQTPVAVFVGVSMFFLFAPSGERLGSLKALQHQDKVTGVYMSCLCIHECSIYYTLVHLCGSVCCFQACCCVSTRSPPIFLLVY